MNQEIQQAKETVLTTSKAAFAAGLFAGTSGNLSVFVRSEGIVAITPSSVRYETMCIDDIVLINLEGEVQEGRHAPSSEYLLHCELYKAREDANAIVHTHSPYATAFAVNRRSIPFVLIEMLPFLGGDLRVAPLQLPGTLAVGQGAVCAMTGRTGCLLANHGVVVVGSNMPEAYIRAEYVEDAAKICSLAMHNGSIFTIPPELENRMRASL